MRHIRAIITIFIINTGTLLSQNVTVIDAEDLHPLPDVVILNESNSRYLITNRSGKADISGLNGEKKICFRHFTYRKICLSPEELENCGYLVKLDRKVFAIEESVVSASRREQSRTEVPNHIVTVRKPEIELHNPQTAADLLNLSGEVFVQKSQLGGGSPMIRGFATNRVLIVVDGVRMNNAIYREGNIQNVISLDANELESTEIIAGPGAIVYGSDAIGGVMDFHTTNPVYSGSRKSIINADGLMRYSTAGNEKTLHLNLNLGRKNFAFITGVTLSDYADLKMGSHKYEEYLRREYVRRIDGIDSVIANSDPRRQKFTGYSQVNTLNKLKIRVSPKTEILLANHYSRLSDVPRYDRLIQYKSAKLRYGDWYYGPQIWIMNMAEVISRSETFLFDRMNIIAAQQYYSESRHDRNFGSTSINEQTEKVNIYSLNMDFDLDLGSKEQLLYYGFELVANDIRSTARQRDITTSVSIPAGSRYPNGDNRYSSYSAYAGYKNNIKGKLTLNTGLRYNYVSLRSEIADNSFYEFPFTSISISSGAVTGSAGLVYRIIEDLSAGLNLSSGFRAPNLDDAGKIFDSAPGVVVVPNQDLKPEYAWSADLSLTGNIGKLIHSEVTIYYTILTNAMVKDAFTFRGEDSIIYRGELSRVEAITNSGTANVYGINLSILANLTRHISIKSVLNLNEGYEEDGDPLRHTTPLFGSTQLTYSRGKFSSNFFALYNGPKRFEKMAPSEIEKPYLYATDSNGNPWSPGWFTLNLKLSYEILNRFKFTTGIENILDLRYRPYSSGIVSPGRNFIISLKIDL